MQKAQKTTALYRRLGHYILPFWPMLLLGVMANVLYSGIDAGFTYMLKNFMDKSFINKDMAFVRLIPVIIFLGILLRGFVSATAGFSMTWVARSVVRVLRQRVFKHILHLPVSDYDKAPSGQLLSKLLYDVEQVAQVSADALTTFVQSSCLVIGFLVVMFIISWQMSLLFLVSVPFVAIIVSYTNKRTRKASHQVQASMADVTSIAGESIDAYQVVRIFGGQKKEAKRFNQATDNAFKQDLKVAKYKVLNIAGVQGVIALGISGIVMMAIYLSNNLNVTAGGFISLIAAMLQLIKPMKNLSTVNSTIQRGLAGAESIFHLFDTPIEQSKAVKTLKQVKGDVSYQNVFFAYERSKPVLNGLNLSIKAGETVALVGRSGSGKSTIVNLLPRFYDIDRGDILIDDTPIGALSLENLREHIALVSQHVVLFNDTLKNNIAYGRNNVSDDEVMAAAKKAYVTEFLDSLPNGLDTLVGENGVLLSGGQRQRIAIARAILKNAPILILDEATSALDSQSEGYIQQALNQVIKGRTTIVIAHRLSTIERADKIIVLDKGKILEIGTHQHLLSLDGHYAKLYRLQYLKQAEMA